MLGLQYDSPKVRILSINQIEKCQESEATIQEMVILSLSVYRSINRSINQLFI